MSGVAVAGLAVGAYGAEQQAQAASSAAEGQQRASDLTLAQMQQQFNLAQNQMAPWLQAGQGALTEQQALMGLGGDTQGALASLMNAPGTQFRLQGGERALAGSTAARGGMGSGKAMTAATQYGQNFASNEYANRLAQLAGLSGQGQSAASGMGQTGMNYAGNVGNVLMGNANVQGAAGMAGANARQSGLVGGAQLGMNLFDYMNQPRSTSTVSTPNLGNSALSKTGTTGFTGPSYLNPESNKFGSGSSPSWWSNIYGTSNFGQGGTSNQNQNFGLDFLDLYKNPYEQYL